jgi:RNA polymerase sigma-70 factor (ECF subfamily)
MRQRSDVDVVSGEDSAEGNARWTSLASAMARAVRRQCPAWLANHAEDIAQVALAKVIAIERQREGLQPFTSFYLQRVAHSALVDEIRRRRRRPEVSLDGEIEAGEHAAVIEPPAAGNPETEAAARELGVAIRDCLSAATRDRRLAVSLYLQGHTVPEAARVLGWTAKRVENLVYRGLAVLRECLLRKGHKP